jgi:uncharacterized protein YndB with AHSA1/START domain
MVTLVVRKTIRASAERLFTAWTDPAQLKLGWGPHGVQCTEAEVDLRIGGRYRIAKSISRRQDFVNHRRIRDDRTTAQARIYLADRDGGKHFRARDRAI